MPRRGMNLIEGLLFGLAQGAQSYVQGRNQQAQLDFEREQRRAELARQLARERAEQERFNRGQRVGIAADLLRQRPLAPPEAYEELAGLASGRVRPELTATGASALLQGLRRVVGEQDAAEIPVSSPGRRLFSGIDLGPTAPEVEFSQRQQLEALRQQHAESQFQRQHSGALELEKLRQVGRTDLEGLRQAGRRTLHTMQERARAGDVDAQNYVRAVAQYLAAGGDPAYQDDYARSVIAGSRKETPPRASAPSVDPETVIKSIFPDTPWPAAEPSRPGPAGAPPRPGSKFFPGGTSPQRRIAVDEGNLAERRRASDISGQRADTDAARQAAQARKWEGDLRHAAERLRISRFNAQSLAEFRRALTGFKSFDQQRAAAAMTNILADFPPADQARIRAEWAGRRPAAGVQKVPEARGGGASATVKRHTPGTPEYQAARIADQRRYIASLDRDTRRAQAEGSGPGQLERISRLRQRATEDLRKMERALARPPAPQAGSARERFIRQGMANGYNRRDAEKAADRAGIR